MSEFEYASDSMFELYLFESTTLLDQLDDILLHSEKEGKLSAGNIDEIFRIMHTIKGSSAMMEFDTISHVSHKLEDLFYVIRDRGIGADCFRELFDLVLKVSDFLKDEVEKIRLGQKPAAGNTSLINEIQRLLERLNGNDPAAQENDPAGKGNAPADHTEKDAPDETGSGKGRGKHSGKGKSTSKDKSGKQGKTGPGGGSDGQAESAGPTGNADPEESHVPAKSAAPEEGSIRAGGIYNGERQGNLNTYFLHVYFNAGCQMENIRAFMLVNKLEAIGRVTETIPEELETNKDASSIISQNGFYCSLTTELKPEAIVAMTRGTLSVYTIEFLDAMPNAPVKSAATPLKAPAVQPAEAEKDSSANNPEPGDQGNGKTGKQQNLISVDLNKLDTLMDLVGEIVITESMVSGSADLAGLELDNFNRAARQLRKLTDELQDIVMSIRMVPIASTFQKMRRIVRDMGRKLDKEVDLVLMGETTEVDKTIVDAIADPLMHLVRNAMDHAIEDKDGRIAMNKDPVGRIILSAQNVGGDIIITVSDDGKGLDAELILEKAKEKKLLTKAENEYTEKEIFNLLTVPGFSTKDSVTEYSGRGVGMDVVKNNIEKIGGTVTIESTKGAGTNVFFKIPLTLAIIASMEVRVGKDIYAIPIANIRESFKASPKQLLSDPDRNEMIMIRGVCYPIIRLHRIFHIEGAQTDIVDGILLLVDSGDRLACILADELLGKHQVVVKPLPVFLGRYAAKAVGLAGCTIMGDGSISLILDIPGILERY